MRPSPADPPAEVAIVAADPAFAGLVARWGPCPLGVARRGRSHFEALASSITSQQLAGAAAKAIWGRVRALVPGPFTPDAVLALGPSPLRAAGLSAAKARAVLDLAERVDAGKLPLARIGRRDDDEIVVALTSVRGIGRWTAEMFCMFQLGRLDVWPTGDLGVRQGYGLAHGIPTPAPGDLQTAGDGLRPWRSVAAWYCWRAVEESRGATPPRLPTY